MEHKLYSVYLGGRAPKCNIELHDVVFVVGNSIEDTYEQLMDKWFGDVKGLHLDSWMELSVVDGHRITLKKEKSDSSKKLYFINLGAYLDGEFIEKHANALLVAESERDVKRRAKERLLVGMNTVHTDDLYDVDDCLTIDEVNGFYVHLEPTQEPENLIPNNGYHIVPKKLVSAYIEKHSNL